MTLFRWLLFTAATVGLSGCMIPELVTELREYGVQSEQIRLVDQTVVSRIRKAAPQLKIGFVECGGSRPLGPYVNLCTIPVDGKAISVGLRYDEDRGREVTDLLGTVIRTNTLERSIDEGAWVAYAVRGHAACGSTPVRVEPVGSSLHCEFLTRDGRTYEVRMRVDARLTPHAVIAPLTGLHHVASIAGPFVRLEQAFRANAKRVPGPVVGAYLNAAMVPYLRAMEPSLNVGKVSCPPYLDAGISTLQAAVADGCWMRSRFGYLQIAVFTGDAGQLDFQNLSRLYDLHKLVMSVKRLQARFARAHPSAALASIDCGAQSRIVLTLLSVHYCAVRLSDGHRGRIGIEYYDPFEGPHVVVERAPRQG